MWLRRTRQAERALIDARAEARYQGQYVTQSQHLLLALVQNPNSFSARVLARLGLSLPEIRSEIERSDVGPPERHPVQMAIPSEYYSPPVLVLAAAEAQRLQNTYLGTEHLLLGLISEQEGMASRVLANLGVDLERTRSAVMAIQADLPE